jgi:hypothetical protein
LRSRAFMGLPWARKAAGMGGVVFIAGDSRIALDRSQGWVLR